MSQPLISVATLLNLINNNLRQDYQLQNVLVSGEIGRFTAHSSGHWYFALKDNMATIDAVMFRSANQKVGFLPQTGDKVIAQGHVDVFEAGGRLQLIVSSLKPAGQGDLFARLAQIKQQLSAAGYFEESHKQPIPPFAQKVGVITGNNSAAWADIEVTIRKRWPATIVPCYALVQGEGSVESLIEALNQAEAEKCDVIIIARGGGSMEDLWSFNDPKLAKAIYDCPIPIITGIGHQIDFTVAEMVADMRCATPTAAAQMAVSDRVLVKEQLNQCQNQMLHTMMRKAEENGQKLDYLRSRLAGFGSVAANKRLSWLRLDNALIMAMSLQLQHGKNQTTSYRQQLIDSLNNYSQRHRQSLNQSIQVLDSVSPLKVMRRGYALTLQDDKIIKSVKQVEMDKTINIHYPDGSLTVNPIERISQNGKNTDL